MKVLHVIDKLSMDGVNPSSCTVLFGGWNPHMQKLGCEMSVMSLAQDQEVGTYLRDRGIEDHYSSNPRHVIKVIGQIEELATGLGADIIHLHGYGAAHFGRVAARRSGILNVVHEHAVLKVKPVHYVIDRLLRNMTDAAVAVSRNVREFMIRGRSIPADRIRVIGNGIDLGRFLPKSPSDIQSAREIIGVDRCVPIVGAVTRFRQEKGTEDLIRAFGEIRRRFDEARLVIVGDGPLREMLRDIAEHEGVSDSVMWLGFRSDVERIMPAFDVQVIPSLTEGFPLALAEGMAIGNAMVVTEVGGMRELGRDLENLLFVPPRDPSAIANASIRLFEDTALALAISEAARESARSMDVAQSANALVGLYSEMIASRR